MSSESSGSDESPDAPAAPEPASSPVTPPPFPAPAPEIFRALFDAAPQPLLLMAADAPRFTMLAVNAAHAFAFGTTPQSLTGWGVLEVFPPDAPAATLEFRDAIRRSLEAVMRTGAADQMSARAYDIPGPDGEMVERYWSAINAPIVGPDGRITHIVSTVHDATGEVQERRSEDARRLLMREVDHRARNTMAIAQSFVRLSTASSIAALRDVLEGRIEALARAQTSLAARKWEGAWLDEVVRATLAALPAAGRQSIGGPRVLLGAEQVQAVSMILHELATNAAKYGALSRAEGELTLTWTQPDPAPGDPTPGDPIVALTWRETGGPRLKPNAKPGFGSRLISQLVQQLHGQIARDWRPEGLAAELTFPVSIPDDDDFDPAI